jgi:hypothetical protein
MRPCCLAPLFALFASAGPIQAAPALTVQVRDAIPSGVMMAVAGAMQKNILTVDMAGADYCQSEAAWKCQTRFTQNT